MLRAAPSTATALGGQVQLQTFATAFVLQRYAAALKRLGRAPSASPIKGNVWAIPYPAKKLDSRARSRSWCGPVAALSAEELRADTPANQPAEQDFSNVGVSEELRTGGSNLGELDITAEERRLLRMSRRRGEQKWYLFAAIASTTGFTTLAAAAVIYRFVWQMPVAGAIPYTEILGTFLLAGGATVGMEYWARWAHRALWHASLWNMHASHHRPRDGPFETNDVFAIINAVPAIALLLYGLLNRGLVPGLCFGAGLGITMFGIAYMFVHDGLVHRRFPVGPVADVPYLKKVAAAHQLHHADLFDGVPYGLFLGPKELEAVGGEGELEKLLLKKAAKDELRKSTHAE